MNADTGTSVLLLFTGHPADTVRWPAFLMPSLSVTEKPIWDRLNNDQILTRFITCVPSFLSAVFILAAFWVFLAITRPGSCYESRPNEI